MNLPPNFLFFTLGAMAAVWGSLRPRNTTLGADPNWQCLLDGIEIGTTYRYPTRSYSNFLYCSKRVPEGHHTLQFNTIIQSETLYVDIVQYQAAASADIGSAWTELRASDGRFKYSSGWTTDEYGFRRWTYTPGAWLTYDFNGMVPSKNSSLLILRSTLVSLGTAVIWGGYTRASKDIGEVAGMGQYMIDGEKSRKSFTIPSRPEPWSNQLYFNITGLTPGPHRPTVINAGDENSAPLGLSFVYTKNGPDDTPQSPRGPSTKVIGAAVGGSLCAVLLVVLVILAVI